MSEFARRVNTVVITGRRRPVGTGQIEIEGFQTSTLILSSGARNVGIVTGAGTDNIGSTVRTGGNDNIENSSVLLVSTYSYWTGAIGGNNYIRRSISSDGSRVVSINASKIVSKRTCAGRSCLEGHVLNLFTCREAAALVDIELDD